MIFSSTCRNLTRSPHTSGGTSESTIKFNSKSLAMAIVLSNSCASSTKELMLNHSGFRRIMPASTLDRSRISLMTLSRPSELCEMVWQ